MALLLKSSYFLYCSQNPNAEGPKNYISLHLGLHPFFNFAPRICFVQKDQFIVMSDAIFLELRKYFSKVDHFFNSEENVEFQTIDLGNIVIQAFADNGIKSIFIWEYNQSNEVRGTIELGLCDWQQLESLRDVLCLKLSLLRKYSIYARIIFDRLVNHMATFESNEVDIFQLPTDMIYQHQFLKLNTDQFDGQMCQLLDAEIRAFLSELIREYARDLRDKKCINFTSFFSFL